MSYTSSDEFDFTSHISITNEVPNVNMYEASHSLLHNAMWKWYLGDQKVIYDQHKTTVDRTGEDVFYKSVNGTVSAVYGPAAKTYWDPTSSKLVTDNPTFPTIILSGNLVVEYDLLLHEMYRYLGYVYPEHPDRAILLTHNEFVDRVLNAGAIIDFSPNLEFYENVVTYRNATETSDELVLEKAKKEIRLIKSWAEIRKYGGSARGYSALVGTIERKGNLYPVYSHLVYKASSKKKDTSLSTYKDANGNVFGLVAIPTSELDVDTNNALSLAVYRSINWLGTEEYSVSSAETETTCKLKVPFYYDYTVETAPELASAVLSSSDNGKSLTNKSTSGFAGTLSSVLSVTQKQAAIDSTTDNYSYVSGGYLFNRATLTQTISRKADILYQFDTMETLVGKTSDSYLFQGSQTPVTLKYPNFFITLLQAITPQPAPTVIYGQWSNADNGTWLPAADAALAMYPGQLNLTPKYNSSDIQIGYTLDEDTMAFPTGYAKDQVVTNIDPTAASLATSPTVMQITGATKGSINWSILYDRANCSTPESDAVYGLAFYNKYGDLCFVQGSWTATITAGSTDNLATAGEMQIVAIPEYLPDAVIETSLRSKFVSNGVNLLDQYAEYLAASQDAAYTVSQREGFATRAAADLVKINALKDVYKYNKAMFCSSTAMNTYNKIIAESTDETIVAAAKVKLAQLQADMERSPDCAFSLVTANKKTSYVYHLTYKETGCTWIAYTAYGTGSIDQINLGSVQIATLINAGAFVSTQDTDSATLASYDRVVAKAYNNKWVMALSDDVTTRNDKLSFYQKKLGDVPMAVLLASFERLTTYGLSAATTHTVAASLNGTIEDGITGTVLYAETEAALKVIRNMAVGYKVTSSALEEEAVITEVEDTYCVINKVAINTGVEMYYFACPYQPFPEDIENCRVLATREKELGSYVSHSPWDQSLWPNGNWPSVSTNTQFLPAQEVTAPSESYFWEMVKVRQGTSPVAHDYTLVDGTSEKVYDTNLLTPCELIGSGQFIATILCDRLQTWPSRAGITPTLMTADQLDFVSDDTSILPAGGLVKVGAELTIETDNSGYYSLLTGSKYTDPSIHLKAQVSSAWKADGAKPRYAQIGTAGSGRNAFWNSIDSVSYPNIYGTTVFDQKVANEKTVAQNIADAGGEWKKHHTYGDEVKSSSDSGVITELSDDYSVEKPIAEVELSEFDVQRVNPTGAAADNYIAIQANFQKESSPFTEAGSFDLTTASMVSDDLELTGASWLGDFTPTWDAQQPSLTDSLIKQYAGSTVYYTVPRDVVLVDDTDPSNTKTIQGSSIFIVQIPSTATTVSDCKYSFQYRRFTLACPLINYGNLFAAGSPTMDQIGAEIAHQFLSGSTISTWSAFAAAVIKGTEMTNDIIYMMPALANNTSFYNQLSFAITSGQILIAYKLNDAVVTDVITPNKQFYQGIPLDKPVKMTNSLYQICTGVLTSGNSSNYTIAGQSQSVVKTVALPHSNITQDETSLQLILKPHFYAEAYAIVDDKLTSTKALINLSESAIKYNSDLDTYTVQSYEFTKNADGTYTKVTTALAPYGLIFNNPSYFRNLDSGIMQYLKAASLNTDLESESSSILKPVSGVAGTTQLAANDKIVQYRKVELRPDAYSSPTGYSGEVLFTAAVTTAGGKTYVLSSKDSYAAGFTDALNQLLPLNSGSDILFSSANAPFAHCEIVKDAKTSTAVATAATGELHYFRNYMLAVGTVNGTLPNQVSFASDVISRLSIGDQIIAGTTDASKAPSYSSLAMDTTAIPSVVRCFGYRLIGISNTGTVYYSDGNPFSGASSVALTQNTSAITDLPEGSTAKDIYSDDTYIYAVWDLDSSKNLDQRVIYRALLSDPTSWSRQYASMAGSTDDKPSDVTDPYYTDQPFTAAAKDSARTYIAAAYNSLYGLVVASDNLFFRQAHKTSSGNTHTYWTKHSFPTQADITYESFSIQNAGTSEAATSFATIYNLTRERLASSQSLTTEHIATAKAILDDFYLHYGTYALANANTKLILGSDITTDTYEKNGVVYKTSDMDSEDKARYFGLRPYGLKTYSDGTVVGSIAEADQNTQPAYIYYGTGTLVGDVRYGIEADQWYRMIADFLKGFCFQLELLEFNTNLKNIYFGASSVYIVDSHDQMFSLSYDKLAAEDIDPASELKNWIQSVPLFSVEGTKSAMIDFTELADSSAYHLWDGSQFIVASAESKLYTRPVYSIEAFHQCSTSESTVLIGGYYYDKSQIQAWLGSSSYNELTISEYNQFSTEQPMIAISTNGGGLFTPLILPNLLATDTACKVASIHEESGKYIATIVGTDGVAKTWHLECPVANAATAASWLRVANTFGDLATDTASTQAFSSAYAGKRSICPDGLIYSSSNTSTLLFLVSKALSIGSQVTVLSVDTIGNTVTLSNAIASGGNSFAAGFAIKTIQHIVNPVGTLTASQIQSVSQIMTLPINYEVASALQADAIYNAREEMTTSQRAAITDGYPAVTEDINKVFYKYSSGSVVALTNSAGNNVYLCDYMGMLLDFTDSDKPVSYNGSALFGKTDEAITGTLKTTGTPVYSTAKQAQTAGLTMPSSIVWSGLGKILSINGTSKTFTLLLPTCDASFDWTNETYTISVIASPVVPSNATPTTYNAVALTSTAIQRLALGSVPYGEVRNSESDYPWTDDSEAWTDAWDIDDYGMPILAADSNGDPLQVTANDKSFNLLLAGETITGKYGYTFEDASGATLGKTMALPTEVRKIEIPITGKVYNSALATTDNYSQYLKFPVYLYVNGSLVQPSTKAVALQYVALASTEQWDVETTTDAGVSFYIVADENTVGKSTVDVTEVSQGTAVAMLTLTDSLTAPEYAITCGGYGSISIDTKESVTSTNDCPVSSETDASTKRSISWTTAGTITLGSTDALVVAAIEDVSCAYSLYTDSLYITPDQECKIILMKGSAEMPASSWTVSEPSSLVSSSGSTAVIKGLAAGKQIIVSAIVNDAKYSITLTCVASVPYARSGATWLITAASFVNYQNVIAYKKAAYSSADNLVLALGLTISKDAEFTNVSILTTDASDGTITLGSVIEGLSYNSFIEVRALTQSEVTLTTEQQSDVAYAYKLSKSEVDTYQPDRIAYPDTGFPKSPYLYKGVLYNPDTDHFYSSDYYTNQNDYPVLLANEKGQYLTRVDGVEQVWSAGLSKTRVRTPSYMYNEKRFAAEFFLTGKSTNPFWQTINLWTNGVEKTSLNDSYRSGTEIATKQSLQPVGTVIPFYSLRSVGDFYKTTWQDQPYLRTLDGKVSFMIQITDEFKKGNVEVNKYGIQGTSGFSESSPSIDYTMTGHLTYNGGSEIQEVTELGLFDQDHKLIMYATFPAIEIDSSKHGCYFNILVKEGNLSPVK